MAKITKVTKQTDNPYVNLYHIEGINKKGHPSNYYVASRARRTEDLQLVTGKNNTAGVAIYALAGPKHDKVVLVRQYRYPINGCVYELPAGLVEEGEDFHEAAAREMHEETGLSFHPIRADRMYEEPRYTTIGMTDESVATVYGYADGRISGDYMEESEEIQVVLADKQEVRRILREERVAIMCAYQLMHFLQDQEPFAFLGEAVKN